MKFQKNGEGDNFIPLDAYNNNSNNDNDTYRSVMLQHSVSLWQISRYGQFRRYLKNHLFEI